MKHLLAHSHRSLHIGERDHLDVLALLPEYVTMLVLDQIPSSEWYAVEAHLRTCARCRQEAQTLQQLMLESYEHPLPEVVAPPMPDLSFLRKPFGTRVSSIPPIVLPLSTAFLAQTRVWMVARSKGFRKRNEYSLPRRIAQDPDVTIEIYEHSEQPEIGQIRISIEYPERDPFDQEGTRVILQAGTHTLEGQTNLNGVVLFTDVQLSDIEGWEITIFPASPGE